VREKLLKRWTWLTATHPLRVMICKLVITILGAISVSRAGMDIRCPVLLPTNDPKAQEFEVIITGHKSASTFLVVVRGEEQQIKSFADAVTPEVIDNNLSQITIKKSLSPAIARLPSTIKLSQRQALLHVPVNIAASLIAPKTVFKDHASRKEFAGYQQNTIHTINRLVHLIW
jgi:hypothetical protein